MRGEGRANGERKQVLEGFVRYFVVGQTQRLQIT